MGIRVFFNIVVFLCLVNFTAAQSNSTVFKGRIKSADLDKTTELVVEFYDDFLLAFSPTIKKVFSCPVDKDGHLRLEIEGGDRFGYIECFVVQNGSKVKTLFGQLSNKLFLIRIGDVYDLDIDIDDGAVVFTESDHILKSQYQINLIMPPKGAGSRLTELANTKKYKRALFTEKIFFEHTLDTKLSLLESYKREMDSSLYQMILNKTIAEEYYGFARRIFILFVVSATERRKAIRDFVRAGGFRVPEAYTEIFDKLSVTPYYSEFLFERGRLEILTENYLHEIGVRVKFEKIYGSLDTLDPGLIKDRAILTVFANQAKRVQEASFVFIQDALGQITDSTYRNMLSTWYEKQNIGAPAFNFSLTDVNDRTHTLDDYKGKIILIDFWFNGCHGCTQIPPVLKKIIQHFQNSQRDIVFLSVNVDTNREKWLAGLELGIYTTEGQIDLYTNGEGTMHPLIAHYNFSSFPQLLLIGKDGKLITANPPDPRKDDGKKLIELIEKE